MIYKIIKYTWIVLILSIGSVVLAEEKAKSIRKPMSIWHKESILILNSLSASYYPEVFGVFTTLISPLLLSGDEHNYIKNTGFTGAATIGLYNALELKKDKYTKNEIFKQNMIAFHVLFGALHILEGRYGQIPASFSLQPFSGGFAIGYNLEF